MPARLNLKPGLRVVVRIAEGRDQIDQRMKFRDFIGHVISWDHDYLYLSRDPAANGSRPASQVQLRVQQIVRIKALAERTYPLGHHDHWIGPESADPHSCG